jgi:hypothetical protein
MIGILYTVELQPVGTWHLKAGKDTINLMASLRVE